MDPMEEIRQTFFIECEELLEAMEAGLLAMSEGENDSETVNAVFRAVHSIKGGAGAFGLEDLVRFAHTFETTLDEVRSDRLAPDENVMRVLLSSGDVLSDLVAAARDGETVDPSRTTPLIDELVAFVGGGAGEDDDSAEDDEPDDFVPMSLDFDFDDEEDTGPKVNVFRISFRPHKALYARGNETTLLFRALKELGEISVEVDASDLPPFDECPPDENFLSWQVELTTEKNQGEVEEVFEFVEDDCDLEITSVDQSSEQTEEIDTAEIDLEENDTDIEISNDTVAENSEPTLESNDAETGEEKKTPEEEKPVAASEAKPKETSQKSSTAKAEPNKESSGPKATVRVDLDRVDRLINLVGELVINQAMLSECVFDAGVAQNSSVATGLEEFKQLTREVQESVMAIRAQPVKSLFQRMSRIVREASAATGKSVQLVTEGDTTEVDKTVIERLADPLTHMIRNAVDHGLESPEKRAESDKSPRGTVQLLAAHRSGRVIIEVKDDGAGINREKVKQIAIDKELIPADAELSNSEIDNLLFMPGFSTANEVSDLSGRGVGMDVVKRAIQALGGRIVISSMPGKGTTFSISLPLTLAVLDGMVVNVSNQTLVAPLSSIVETLKPAETDVHIVCDNAATILIRGVFVPIIDVGAQLGYRDPLTDYSDTVILLVETDEGEKTALVVDAIQDQRQVVIKGLEDNYGHVPGIAAATILGDGRIALILDADALVASMPQISAPDENSMQLAG